ncbi:hypothetical protein HZS_3596, partial [Henneguya salminicola]
DLSKASVQNDDPNINYHLNQGDIDKNEGLNLIETLESSLLIKITEKLNLNSIINLSLCCKMLHKRLENDSVWLNLYNKYLNMNCMCLEGSKIHPILDCGVVSISNCGAVLLWRIDLNNLQNRCIYEILYKHNKLVTSFDHNKSILITGSNDCSAFMFDMRQLCLIRKITFTYKVTCVAISEIWIAVSIGNGSILLIDKFFHPFVTILSHSLIVDALKLRRQTLISVSNKISLKIWTLKILDVKWELKLTNLIPILSEDIKFLNKNLVLINDHQTGICLVCLKTYHVLLTYENTQKVSKFNIVG